MPQVILLAVLGAGLYAGIRALARVGEHVAAELKNREDALRQRAAAKAATGSEDRSTLEFDPKSGVYKPADRKV